MDLLALNGLNESDMKPNDALAVLENAVAELSEIVSDNASDNDVITNAIADLSEVVSDMAGTLAELVNAG